MLFRLPSSSVNTLSHSASSKISEWMCMDTIVVALSFHLVKKIVRSSPGGSNDFLSYDFTTDTGTMVPC